MSRATITLMLALTASLSTADAAGPAIVKQVGFGHNANPVVDSLPQIYMPYTPGQRVPLGWKCVTINVPVTETCTKTVCEEQVIQVAKQVPCTVCKQVRIPTEVYKTYIRYKEIRVEDGTLERRSDAPSSELDELEAEIERLERRLEEKSDEDETTSQVRSDAKGTRALAVSRRSNDHPSQPSGHIEGGAMPQDGFERVPVTKVRKKCVKIQVPVKTIVEVDEGCWKEITVCECGQGCHIGHGCRLLGGGATATPRAVVRRVWEPRIVQREVTVIETQDVTVDELYTDYVLRPVPQVQPDAAPDVAPDAAPDAAPDLAPETQPDVVPEEVLVTRDRPVLVPQYVTKAERHYITKTVQTPSTKTVFVPVKQVVSREVPYEVRRIETRRVLVPISPGVVPGTMPGVTPTLQPTMPSPTVSPVEELPSPLPLPAPKSQHKS